MLRSLRILTAGAFFSSTVGAQTLMQPGAWDIQMKMFGENPTTGASFLINESSYRRCLTKEFLEEEPFLNSRRDRSGMEKIHYSCEVLDEIKTENTASWKLKCKLADSITIDKETTTTVSSKKLASEATQTTTLNGNRTMTRIVVGFSFSGPCVDEMPYQ